MASTDGSKDAAGPADESALAAASAALGHTGLASGAEPAATGTGDATSEKPGMSPRAKMRLVTAGLFAVSLICFAAWVFYVRRAVGDQAQALEDMVAGLRDSTSQRNIEEARSQYEGNVFFSHFALIGAVLLSYGGAILLAAGNLASKIDHGKKLKRATKGTHAAES